jgi:hypothetical protein
MTLADAETDGKILLMPSIIFIFHSESYRTGSELARLHLEIEHTWMETAHLSAMSTIGHSMLTNSQLPDISYNLDFPVNVGTTGQDLFLNFSAPYD